MKCETYSSLGDQEEDPQTEAMLHARMVQATGEEIPGIAAIAPAALYLTAILEYVFTLFCLISTNSLSRHVCEYVLLLFLFYYAYIIHFSGTFCLTLVGS